MTKLVRDVMAVTPWAIEATTSLQDAARMMRVWDLHEVFVVDQGVLRGVLSDEAIVVLAIASGRSPSSVLAGESCNPDVPRVQSSQPVTEALAVVEERRAARIPVVDGDRLVGTISLGDLTRTRIRPRG
ncbi:MAG TPA: CBS domain-containing protein [Acidimicrobiales bacterium]|nr:CBS domain-containing protein [Acidimicrobiales bacterium]